MKVLFLNEKFRGADPSCGILSEGPQNMEYAYDSTGFGIWISLWCDAKEFYVSENDTTYKCADVDRTFINLCTQFKPDLIVLTPLRRNELPPNVDRVALAYAAWHLNIPIAGIMWDNGPSSIDMMDRYYPMCKHVISVSPDEGLHKYMSNRWSTDWWLPTNTDIVYDKGYNRELAVAMPGKIYPDSPRAEIVALLSVRDVRVYITPQDEYVPYEEFCERMCRALITVNTGRSNAMEGRTYEATHCGSLLFEPSDAMTSKRYARNIEYVTYDRWWDLDISEEEQSTRKREFVRSIRYYLSHEEEAKEIADRGKTKAQQYTAHTFWRQVFDRMGV
jgi:hypothetical protein